MLWRQLLLHIAKLLCRLSMFISNRPSSLTWTWSARSRPTLPRQSGGQPTSQLQKLFGVRGRGWGVGVLKYPILLETWGFPLVVGWDAGRSEYFLNYLVLQMVTVARNQQPHVTGGSGRAQLSQ